MDRSLPGSSVPGDSPGKNIGLGCHALLQGIFPTQGSNPGLPHCRQILYSLGHQGSPRKDLLSSCVSGDLNYLVELLFPSNLKHSYFIPFSFLLSPLPWHPVSLHPINLRYFNLTKQTDHPGFSDSVQHIFLYVPS